MTGPQFNPIGGNFMSGFQRGQEIVNTAFARAAALKQAQQNYEFERERMDMERTLSPLKVQAANLDVRRNQILMNKAERDQQAELDMIDEWNNGAKAAYESELAGLDQIEDPDEQVSKLFDISRRYGKFARVPSLGAPAAEDLAKHAASIQSSQRMKAQRMKDAGTAFDTRETAEASFPGALIIEKDVGGQKIYTPGEKPRAHPAIRSAASAQLTRFAAAIQVAGDSLDTTDASKALTEITSPDSPFVKASAYDPTLERNLQLLTSQLVEIQKAERQRAFLAAEAAKNREVRVSEGNANRAVRVSEGDKNRQAKADAAGSDVRFLAQALGADTSGTAPVAAAPAAAAATTEAPVAKAAPANVNIGDFDMNAKYEAGADDEIYRIEPDGTRVKLDRGSPEEAFAMETLLGQRSGQDS